MTGGEATSRVQEDARPARNRRVGVRVDMTPLVDVAFLLLTFFMLTTSMTRPQTKEINIPPDSGVTVPVPERNLLNLLVDEHGGIYWAIGMQSPRKIELVNLRSLLRERLTENPRIIALVKVDRKGTYQTLVNIMDELSLANITRLSLAPLLDADRGMIAKAQV